MGRKLKVTALNIKMQPTECERDYLELFKMVHRGKFISKIWGENYGMIGSCSEDNGLIYGNIYKFFSVDPQADWLNSLEVKAVDGLPVPDHLKPNLRCIPYVFSIENHRFFWPQIKHSPSPPTMQKLFQGLFLSEGIEEKFQTIDVEIETDKEKLGEILTSFKAYRKLEIVFTIPNGDTLEDAEEAFTKRLKEQQIERLHEVYGSRRGVKPDIDTQASMSLATKSDGKVLADGIKDDGSIEHVESTSHPRIFKLDYDPYSDGVTEILLKHVSKLASMLAGKKGE